MISIPAFQGFSATTLIFSFLVLTVGFYVLFFSGGYKFSPRSPTLVREGYPVLGALRFFTARWDFFQHARTQSPTGNFSFFLGKHPVVGLTGTDGRRVFFDSRELGFAEGYAVLFGQSASVNSDKEFSGPGGYFSRRIAQMLKADRFNDSMPKLLADTQAAMKKLKNDPLGMTDPFESIYRLVYQLTIRMVACDDIAEDPELLEKSLHLYQFIESSSTPAVVLYPWFPSSGIISRTIAGGKLYMMIKRIVDNRHKTGQRREDPLQTLVDIGDGVPRIIEFIVGALFAGLLNSGINAAWVLCYLAKSPEWTANVREEIQFVAAKYATDKDAPLVEQLADIPREAWESEFPMIELCLKDSIRLQLLGTAFRKNVSGRDLDIGNGQVIPPGAFVTYHTGDIHLDPEVYTDPHEWDPSRYLPSRAEDKKVPYGYMGWGLSRHPCLGMRFAKFEQNIITAFFLATFDYELTDKSGTPVPKTPPVDFNGHSAQKPSQRVFLKYKQR
ncbi:cytochrome P450 [Amylocarpus encephaloides]|uniref:Cytochrome P450 n=1 Tax=Amylocarpus encephaloides TaxID=45428 RepID=A0A9P7YNF1_9HELO|nr:cytochrome P450 [Amylocarpus encephaloides]